MIVKCSYCGSFMKIDESGLPKNSAVKVRCPHCNQIGPIREFVAPEENIKGTDAASEAPDSVASTQKEASKTEQSASGTVTWKLRTKPKLFLWIVASLFIVIFFALLVNIILPGPYGGGPDTGLPPQEYTSPQPGETTRPSPYNRNN